MDAPLIAIPDGASRRRIDACQYHRVRRGITRHPRGGLVPRRLAGRPGLLRRRAAPGRVPEHRHTASQVRGGRPRRCHGVGRRRGTPRAPATRARSHHLPGGRLAAADSPSAEAEHGAAGPTRGVVARPPAAHGQRVARFTAQSPGRGRGPLGPSSNRRCWIGATRFLDPSQGASSVADRALPPCPSEAGTTTLSASRTDPR
jgi:hypothetical protein